MAVYGYIRASLNEGPGVPESDPVIQRALLSHARVDPGRIYEDVAVSVTSDLKVRSEWELLDRQLHQGDILVVSAVDRLGLVVSEAMRIIYDLHRRGVRLRSLAANEGEWVRFLDEDVDTASHEAATGHVVAGMAAYVANQEGQAIRRSTKTGLEAARAKGKEMGRPRRLTDDQLTAIRRDVEHGMKVAAVARKYGVPRSTLRGALSRTG